MYSWLSTLALWYLAARDGLISYLIQYYPVCIFDTIDWLVKFLFHVKIIILPDISVTHLITWHRPGHCVDGMSDHAGWIEGFHLYWDKKISRNFEFSHRVQLSNLKCIPFFTWVSMGILWYVMACLIMLAGLKVSIYTETKKFQETLNFLIECNYQIWNVFPCLHGYLWVSYDILMGIQPTMQWNGSWSPHIMNSDHNPS